MCQNLNRSLQPTGRTSRQIRRWLCFTLVIVCVATSAAAQNDPGTVYVTGGITVSTQEGPSGESSQTYMTAPGGTTKGWSIGGGVFLARPISVEVEWATTGWMRSRQPSRHGMTFNEERRDQFISLLARFHIPPAAAIRIEPVAGVVVTKPEAWGQTEFLRFPDRIEVGPRQEHRLDTGVGPIAGADIRLGGTRAALVPSFRVARTAVSQGYYDDFSERGDIEAIYPGGYPKWTFRAGVNLRIEF